MGIYNTGYSTYVIGTSNNAASSLEVVLYNKSDWTTSPKLPKISLYNMSQVYSVIINNEEGNTKYLRLTRNSSSDPFVYDINNGVLENGFTTILYISNVDNNPVGYTEFLSAQGTINSLDIYTLFNSSVSDFIQLELNNSLGQLRNNSTVEKEFSDSETIYKYTPPSTVKEEIKFSPVYPRYTSHVFHVLDNKYMNLKTDSGFVNTEYGAGKISLNNNVNIDPYGHNYTSHQIGFYGSDIVLYSWSGDRYTIQSLIQRTRFDNPVIYTTESGLDYNTFSDLGTARTILYFSGRFIVTMTIDYPSSLELYDLERSMWIETKYSNFFLDTLDPRSIIRSTPSNISTSNITTYIPEIKNVFIDIDSLSLQTGLCVVKKTGDWYVFRCRLSSIQDYFIYSCIDKSVYTMKSTESPMAINNSLLMIRTVDENNDLDYYTIYCGQGIEYYTEKARAAKNNGSVTLDSELGILFYNGNDEETETYREYYKEGKIKVVHTKDGIFGSIFEGFRRGYYNSELASSIPEIIATFYGIIYYIDSDRNLYYL